MSEDESKEKFVIDLQDDDEDEVNDSSGKINNRKLKDKRTRNENSLVEDVNGKEKKSKLDLRRIFELAKEETKFILVGTVCLVIANLALLAIPYIVGQIIDATTAKDGDPKEKLFNSVILLVMFVTVSSIFASIRAYLFTVAGERVVMRLRKRLFHSIVTQEVAFFDESKTGDLISRLSSDCTVLQNTVTVNVSVSIRSVFTLFSGIFMLFYLSWQLTLLSLSVIPLIILSSVVYGKFVKKIAKAFQDSLAKASDMANEAFSNLRTVKSFSKEEYESENYSARIQDTFNLAKRRSFAFGIFTGLITFLANVVIGFVVWYGGYQVIDGKITAGILTSFIIYTLTVAAAVGVVTGLYGDFMNAVGASERVFALLDRQPRVHWKGGIKPQNVKGVIKMTNVHFHYPSRKDVQVLKGINVELTPGKVVALVGPSGGGKSTIVALLELFYYPTSGSITFDGIDIRSIDPEEYRNHIGLVSQEPALFGMTIAQNIAYGNPNVSIDRIIEVAKMANAHEFIAKFPEGYDTVVGERGIRLSGGQKQRVAIARAFLMDPKILLLDEATSALDAESEYLVKSALEILMKGRTTLVIAHRLSTVKNAHQVCVVDNGIIIEQGTHDELILANGTYKQLVSRQLLQN